MKDYLTQINLQPAANANGSAMASTAKSKKNSFDQILKDSLNNNQRTDKKEMTSNKYTAMLQNKKNQSLGGNSLKQQKSMSTDLEEAVLAKNEPDQVDEKATALLAILQSLSQLLQTNEEAGPEQSMDSSAIEAMKKAVEEILPLALAMEGPVEKIVAEINQQLSALSDEMPADTIEGNVEFMQDQGPAIDMNTEKLLTQLQNIMDKFSNEQEEQPVSADMAPIVKKEMDNQTVPKIDMETMEEVEESIFPTNEKAVKSLREAVETKKDEKVKGSHQNSVQLEELNATKPTSQQKDMSMFLGSQVEIAETNLADPAGDVQPTPVKPTFSNIMEQILPKSEIFIDEERSEMLIQLKPDNLGKLVMKLEVEKGIVVAKFVAESHMVKEILESNMNTLKDSLQQKGLNVQELSVFVGNDGNFQGHQNFMAFQKKQNNSRIKGLGLAQGSSAIQAEAQTVKSLHSENIDFLA
ncbi:flagellar hook-length control protein FliK [Geosporobacter ferrireducens]|uniref:flagellar hook-length control protein FliK n=1 Tax=Geosporobacter ferrireducens TaxID=1424294 RepID=UPI00139EB05F|nr:flagellar hook-length control protein FliK [Geosporobacter ferrireducens]MTI57299.1 flagellar hook-length control protein FliK [Geosporobacter ferrireducens]